MMPRDMELIRTLMLQFEHDDKAIPEGYTELQVAYHVNQMVLQGLIEATVIEGATPDSPGRRRPKSFIFHDITPEGHNFIASIRDEGFWTKLKDEMRKKAVPMTVEFIVVGAKLLGHKLVESIGGHPTQGHGSH